MDQLGVQRSPWTDIALPVFRPVALQVLAACEELHETPSELVHTALSDPVFTAAILSDANVYSPVSTIEEAVDLLGVESVLMTLIAKACDTVMTSAPDAAGARFSMQAHWAHALACSLCAAELATLSGAVSAGVARTAGLLHDIGKLVLYRRDPARYDRVLENTDQPGALLEEAERLAFGEDHARAGRRLLERRNLPLSLQEATWLHHHPPSGAVRFDKPLDLIGCVHIANMLVHAPPFEDGESPALKSRLHRIGIPVDRIHALRTRVHDELQRLTGRLPAADAQAPPEGVHVALAVLQRHGRRLGFAKRKQDRQAAVLESLNRSLLQAMSTPDVERMLTRIVGAACQGLGVQAVQGQFRLADGRTVRSVFPDASPHDSDNLMTHTVAIDAREWGAGTLTVVYAPEAGTSDVLTGLARFAAVAERAIDLVQRYHRARELSEQFIRATPDAAGAAPGMDERLKDLGAVTGQIAHIFNNLLSGILGRTQLMRTYTDDPSRLTEALEKVEQAVHKGARTIRLLQWSSHVDPVPAPDTVDLNVLVYNVVEERAAEPLGRKIAVTTDLDPALPPVRGRPDELHTMLTLVVQNAIEALPQGGTVIIATSGEAEAVVLTVSDTGAGIPPGIRNRIFDPLFTTKGPDHAGLGLSAVRGIVLRHAGRVRAVSEEGQGTTMLIYFPREVDPATRENDNPASVVSETVAGP